MKNNKEFIPALKFDWLTYFYDFVTKLGRLEKRLWKPLLLQANIKENDNVLDFGCGTGTLTIMAKKETPKAIIYGVDIDSNILKIAKTKVENSGYEVFLKLYDGIFLPYKDETYDKVLSTLVFHHLTRNQKIMTLEEIYRTLKYGGELYIVDFGKSKNIVMRGVFLIIQLLDGFSNTSDNVNGLLPEIIKNVGFSEVNEYRWVNTLVGTISFYKAVK